MRINLNTKLALLISALIIGALSLPAFAQMMTGEYGFDDGIMRIWEQSVRVFNPEPW